MSTFIDIFLMLLKKSCLWGKSLRTFIFVYQIARARQLFIAFKIIFKAADSYSYEFLFNDAFSFIFIFLNLNIYIFKYKVVLFIK